MYLLFFVGGLTKLYWEVGEVKDRLILKKWMKIEGQLKNKVFPYGKYMVHGIYFHRKLMHFFEKEMIRESPFPSQALSLERSGDVL